MQTTSPMVVNINLPPTDNRLHKLLHQFNSLPLTDNEDTNHYTLYQFAKRHGLAITYMNEAEVEFVALNS